MEVLWRLLQQETGLIWYVVGKKWIEGGDPNLVYGRFECATLLLAKKVSGKDCGAASTKQG